MTDLVQRLLEPEHHYPGNFDTVKRANAMLSCLCQEAADALEAKDASIEHYKSGLDSAIQDLAKWKALCDQMGNALAIYGLRYDDPKVDKALAAWREME